MGYRLLLLWSLTVPQRPVTLGRKMAGLMLPLQQHLVIRQDQLLQVVNEMRCCDGFSDVRPAQAVAVRLLRPRLPGWHQQQQPASGGERTGQRRESLRMKALAGVEYRMMEFASQLRANRARLPVQS